MIKKIVCISECVAQKHRPKIATIYSNILNLHYLIHPNERTCFIC
jgi:hypothetical protein